MSKPWAKPCNEGREGENSVRVPSRARSQETRVRATRLAHAGQVPPLRPPLEGRKPSGTHIASSSGKDCFELGNTSGKDSFQPTKPKSSIAICRIVTFPLLPPHPFPLFTPAHPNQGAMSRMDAQGDARSVAGPRARPYARRRDVLVLPRSLLLRVAISPPPSHYPCRLPLPMVLMSWLHSGPETSACWRPAGLGLLCCSHALLHPPCRRCCAARLPVFSHTSVRSPLVLHQLAHLLCLLWSTPALHPRRRTSFPEPHVHGIAEWRGE